MSSFVRQLRILKAWAGNPSLDQLRRASELPRSTLSDALSPKRTTLPSLDLVLRYVRACGWPERRVDEWATAWRRVQAASAAPASAGTAVRAVPRQLPAAVRHFVGREYELKALDELAADDQATATVIAAVTGTAGIGKTTLAVHWAHRVADRYPDGQLYINLRGYHPGPPVRPIEALAQFLRALDTPSEQVPVEPDEATARYRSLLAGRRVLVMLDNAASAEQVRPLLPGTPGCLVLVTSRDQLSGLAARDGADRLSLDRLPAPDALDLLRRLVGQRVDKQPAAAAALVDRCVGLPLALRIAAAYLADRPGLSIESYAEQLAGGDQLGLLQVAGDPQTAVRAAFDLSYARLAPGARRLFRLLGLVPGPDVTAASAAALAGTDPGEAGRLLEGLAEAHLLERVGLADASRPGDPGRYACHDLLRAYAAERTGTEDSAADRAAAAERLYRYYLAGAEAAARRLYPQVLLQLPPPEVAGGSSPVVSFVDYGQALRWLESELPNLVAVVVHTAEHGPRPVAWWLAFTLRGYFRLRRITVDWLTTAQAGLAAAVAEHDPRGEAAAQISLAAQYLCRDRYRQGIAHAEEALRLSRLTEWPEGEANALTSLGTAHYRIGLLEQAADDNARALAIYERLGMAECQAGNRYGLGAVYYDLGRLRAAADQLTQALAIARQVGTIGGQAQALTNLGEVRCALGQLDRAEADYAEAALLAREAGDRGQEALTLLLMANARCEVGRAAEAVALVESAVACARDYDNQQIEVATLYMLATVDDRLGRHRAAIGRYLVGLRQARRTGYRYAQSEFRIGLAGALVAIGRYRAALRHAGRALELARRAGYRMLEGKALTAAGTVHLAAGRIGAAGAAAEAALAIHRETGYRLGEDRTRQLLDRL